MINDLEKIKNKLKVLETENLSYQQVFNNSELPMIILSLDGKYLKQNNAYLRLKGYSIDELLIKNNISIVSTEFQPDGQRSIDKARKMNEYVMEKGQHSFEWLHVIADGRQIISRVHIYLINYNSEDCLLTIIQDLSEKKKVEQIVKEKIVELEKKNIELDYAKNELESIFDNSLVGYLTIKNEKIIAKCNNRAADILGYASPKELVGQEGRILYLSEESQNEFEKYCREQLMESGIIQKEYLFAKKDGSPVWLTISANTLDNHISPDISKGILLVVDDITYRKNMEAEINKLYLMAMDANPITRLPGNNSITNRIKEKVKERTEDCIIYVDLDNFKAYNDKYGFARGDEVIDFTANMLCSEVIQDEDWNDFVGHIGGDDFVIIIDRERVKEVTANIISRFDKGIVRFYNDIDLRNKKIISKNRRGVIRQYPIMTISLAGVMIQDMTEGEHYQIVDACAAMKSKAKKIDKSCYVQYSNN